MIMYKAAAFFYLVLIGFLLIIYYIFNKLLK